MTSIATGTTIATIIKVTTTLLLFDADSDAPAASAGCCETVELISLDGEGARDPEATCDDCWAVGCEDCDIATCADCEAEACPGADAAADGVADAAADGILTDDAEGAPA